jgi:hypothetical protein
LNASGSIPNSQTLTFTSAGTYYWYASYSGDTALGGRNLPANSGCSSEPLVVTPAQPTIVTTVSSSSIVIGSGNSFYDTANVSNGYHPADATSPGNGTVTFTLYGPFASSGLVVCTSAIQTYTNITASTSGTTTASYTTSATPYVPTAVGVYQFVATYNGNHNNLTASTSCGDATEQVTVQPATPSIATTILLSDTVKVTGVSGAGPISGTVVFKLYPSTVCTGTVLSTQNATLDGSGMATTPNAVAVNASGVYSWQVTFTPSAGSNYTNAATSCSAEQANITYTAPSPIGP